MSQDRGEPLVVVVDGNLRMSLTPAVDKLLDTLQVLAGLPVRLARFADDDALHLLLLQVLLEPVKEP